MSKIGSHHPFGYLKHKLWPKERSGIKWPIWLATTKSRESLRFPCVQVTCHISLKSSWQGVQLCFKPPLQLKVCTQRYGPPKLQESQFQEFRNSHLEVPRQNVIWVLALWLGTKYTISGEGGGSPQVRVVVNLMSLCLHVARLCNKNVLVMH
jgi:hypothetical protein